MCGSPKRQVRTSGRAAATERRSLDRVQPKDAV
jgi:hypothetical protein